jgi:hypothetical protein
MQRVEIKKRHKAHWLTCIRITTTQIGFVSSTLTHLHQKEEANWHQHSAEHKDDKLGSRQNNHV